MRNGQKHGDCTKTTQQKYIIRENHPTFRPIRLWTRSTLAARCKTAHPDRSTFRPGGCSPGRPRWAKCVFWVHISLNNDLANIRLTLHRALNFESCQKAQKCIKKRRRGCRKRWNSFDFQTDSTFVRLCPPGSIWGMQSPGGWSGGALLACIALHALLAGLQNVTVYTLPGGGCCNL